MLDIVVAEEVSNPPRSSDVSRQQKLKMPLMSLTPLVSARGLMANDSIGMPENRLLQS